MLDRNQNPSKRPYIPTMINTQTLSSLKSAVNASQDQQILQSSKFLNKTVRYGCYLIVIKISMKKECKTEIRT